VKFALFIFLTEKTILKCNNDFIEIFRKMLVIINIENRFLIDENESYIEK